MAADGRTSSCSRRSTTGRRVRPTRRSGRPTVRRSPSTATWAARCRCSSSTYGRARVRPAHARSGGTRDQTWHRTVVIWRSVGSFGVSAALDLDVETGRIRPRCKKSGARVRTSRTNTCNVPPTSAVEGDRLNRRATTPARWTNPSPRSRTARTAAGPSRPPPLRRSAAARLASTRTRCAGRRTVGR